MVAAPSSGMARTASDDFGSWSEASTESTRVIDLAGRRRRAEQSPSYFDLGEGKAGWRRVLEVGVGGGGLGEVGWSRAWRRVLEVAWEEGGFEKWGGAGRGGGCHPPV